VICGVSWELYLALDEALGDDRPGPRFYYLNGELEIMTTTNEQSRMNRGVFMRKKSFPISRLKLLSPQAASASWSRDPFMAAGSSCLLRRVSRIP